MALPAESTGPIGTELHGLREENRTLYGVIKLVSSSLELVPMLQGVVDLATEATGCHACFIYLLEDDELVIRAASPVFGEAVGNVRFSVQEGLTGWVARHRRPEFIRDRAMKDPRMKYVPLLEEESFQSMAAVPVLSRAGETIGVIVLHTRAPHEFGEDTPNLLTHIASLVSGAIENAQLYDRERRRVYALTGLSELAQQVAAAPDAAELGEVLVRGTAALLDADACQLLRVGPDGETVAPLASHPENLPAPALTSVAEVMLAGLENRSGPWPPRRGAGALAVGAPGRCARHAAGRGRGAGWRAVRGDDDLTRLRRRGRRDLARHRPPGRGCDQAGRADRGPHQGQHDQGPVRRARSRRDDVCRHQGRRRPLRSQRAVPDPLGAARRIAGAVHGRVARGGRGAGPGGWPT